MAVIHGGLLGRLDLASATSGLAQLGDMINVRVGKLELGAVDTALRCNMEAARLLKRFGGREQKARPETWERERRRETQSTHNERSDRGKKGSRLMREEGEKESEGVIDGLS